jgi:hypothetical protein
MWINFSCNGRQSYMIKIYVGGINIVSGEPAVEDGSTRLRRQALLANSGATMVRSVNSLLCLSAAGIP